VLLTKDNPAKRRWTKCVFCGSPETIDYLFITCHFSGLVWRVVHFTYNIPPPISVTNVFGNWLNEIDKKMKSRIRVEVYVLIWVNWNYQNDVMFNRCAKPKKIASYSQGCFIGSI
jgi:hypothetical protein